MSKKPAPPPGLSGRPRPHEGDVSFVSSSSSNSLLLLAGLDGVRSRESLPQVSPLHPQSSSAAVSSADPQAEGPSAASATTVRFHLPRAVLIEQRPKVALGVPPLAVNVEGSANGLLLSPRAQMRKTNISSLQLRDAPPAPNKRSPTSATPAPIISPEKAQSPTDFSYAFCCVSSSKASYRFQPCDKSSLQRVRRDTIVRNVYHLLSLTRNQYIIRHRG